MHAGSAKSNLSLAPVDGHSMRMRAVLHRHYGGPELLERGEVPQPRPGPEQVLVEVHAASINAADYRIMRADPWLVRLGNGLLRPRKWPVLGSDFAGRVVAVGDRVTSVSIGDRVFGDASADGRGSFAELVCVRASALALIPAGTSMVEAAAVPLAGITALQAIRDLGEVRPGQAVLVHGAGGGVGGFVVQIAKAYGAHVTAVCGPASREQVERFGADEVIDYTRTDFSVSAARYALIVAVHGHRRPRVYARCLQPGGRLVVVGGHNRQIFEGLLLAPLVCRASGKRARTLNVDEGRQAEDLAELSAMLSDGRLRVAIDREVPLDGVVEAIRYVEAGHVDGKVVLAVAQPSCESAAL
jgi:NADPH:quinone reductase-like Zn-dependent oxidoreductase